MNMIHRKGQHGITLAQVRKLNSALTDGSRSFQWLRAWDVMERHQRELEVEPEK